MRKIDSYLLDKYFVNLQIRELMRFHISMFLVMPVIVGAIVPDFDENTQFLIEKINTYVKNDYNGDYNSALSKFDTNGDDILDSDELWYALAAMDVGSYMTRSAWVKGIMDYFGEELSTKTKSSIALAELLDFALAM